jgi:hypothetical protein
VTCAAGRTAPLPRCCTGHVPCVDPAHFHLIAPYESDPRKWHKLRWVDRYSGKPYRITTSDEEALYGGNVVRVKTYRDVLAEYRTHPEAKSLGPDGEVCDRQTVGLLQRRPVTRGTLTYVGKESNRLEEVEAGVVHDPEEVYTEYADPRENPWQTLILPVLQSIDSRELAARAGLRLSTARRLQGAKSTLPPARRAVLGGLAAAIAREHLQQWGIFPPQEALACCYVYLEARKLHMPERRCPQCGVLLDGHRRRYCSVICKQQAYRQRQAVVTLAPRTM